MVEATHDSLQKRRLSQMMKENERNMKSRTSMEEQETVRLSREECE